MSAGLISPSLSQVLDDLPPSDVPPQRAVVPTYSVAPSPPAQLMGEPSPSPSYSEELPHSAAFEVASRGEPRFSLGFASVPCRSRGNGPKNARRKRDLVLSVSWGLQGRLEAGQGCWGGPVTTVSVSPQKLVHNVHNHITNEKRFNGSER